MYSKERYTGYSMHRPDTLPIRIFMVTSRLHSTMRPIQSQLSDNLSANKVFLTKEIVQPYYKTAFHFHSECQLTYIVESSGQRVIGDNVEHFEPGELVFLGSNVPHVWFMNSRITLLGARRNFPNNSKCGISRWSVNRWQYDRLGTTIILGRGRLYICACIGRFTIPP